MKLVYVAGRYRGETGWDVEQNIRRAEIVGAEVARFGAAPLIPHSMNRFFNGFLNDDFWLAATMTMLERCDAIVLVPGWESSVGAKAELARAKELGKWVFESVDELKSWLEVSGAVVKPGLESAVLTPLTKTFVSDMRSIGLLTEMCLGCRKVDCGCPCGSSTSVDHSKLSPEASSALSVLHHGATPRNSYRCVFCGKSAEKYRWGPGRIKCPSCGEVQPSPGELEAAKAACVVCSKYWRGCVCESGILVRVKDL
jgi:hypothetical protein